MRKLLILVACVFALSVLPFGPAIAQDSTASVTGTVTNTSGSPMPNTAVLIENTSTGQRCTATTDSNGRYRIDNVPPGHYRVLPASGNATGAPATEFDVRAGQTNTVNISMPGAAGAAGNAANAANAAATATPDNLRMMPAQVFTDFNTLYAYQMPQANMMLPDGQNWGTYNLTTLTPAVTAGGFGQGAGPATAGQRPYFNEWRIDGFDNTNKAQPGTPLAYVSPQATHETTLWQNQFEPVMGHAAGAKSDLFSQDGTNQVHGWLYDYLQNRNLNAVNQQLAAIGIRDNPRYDQNRLGGAVGLPIIRNKAFFYGNFEYIPFGIDRIAAPGALAPTASGFATLQGASGISQTNLAFLQQSLAGNVGEATGTATFGNTVVPVGPVNALTRAWQNSYMGTGTVDITPWTHDAAHVRYVYNRRLSNNLVGAGLPAFAQGASNYGMLADVSETHTFTNGMINELRLGYNRWSNLLNPFNPSAPALPGISGVPSLFFGGAANLSIAPQQLQSDARMNTYHLNDTFGVRMGTHNFRLGFDGLRVLGFQQNFPGTAGTYGYSSVSRFLQDLPPDILSSRTFGSNRYDSGQYLISGFIQDAWSMRPGFNLYLGLRYDYNTVPQGMDQTAFAAASIPGFSFSKPYPDTANFSPNVGFAWAPAQTFMNRKFVVRSSFGMYYATLYGSNLYQGLPVAGSSFAQTGSLGSNTPGFLANGGIQSTGTGFTGTGPTGINASNLTPQQLRSQISTFVPIKDIVPYTMNWNFGIETEAWHNSTLTLKYVGSRAVHLPVLTNFNAPAALTSANALPVFTSQPSASQVAGLTQTLNSLQASQTLPLAASGFANPLLGFANEGNSWYNGAVVEFNQRFAGGLQMLANYTWSHLYDDSTGTPIDLGMTSRFKESSLYDRRHRLAISGVLDLAGAFKNTYSVVRNVIANMQLAGTFTFQSPQYLPIWSGVDTGLTGIASGSGVQVNPNGNGLFGGSLSPITNSSGQTVGYLASNPNSSIIPAGPGSLSTPLRSRFPLDSTRNVNLALTKGFSWHDRVGFQIRGEAYNLFNRPQYTGGLINTLEYTPFAQFPLPFTNPASTQFNNSQQFLSSNARILQVALRLTF